MAIKRDCGRSSNKERNGKEWASITVFLPKGVHRWIKMYALHHDVTMQEVFIESLQMFFDENDGPVLIQRDDDDDDD